MILKILTAVCIIGGLWFIFSGIRLILKSISYLIFKLTHSSAYVVMRGEPQDEMFVGSNTLNSRKMPVIVATAKVIVTRRFIAEKSFSEPLSSQEMVNEPHLVNSLNEFEHICENTVHSSMKSIVCFYAGTRSVDAKNLIANFQKQAQLEFSSIMGG